MAPGDELVAAGPSDPATESSLSPEPKPRRRRGMRVAIAILVVIAAAALIASRWSVPYYAITPGHAFNIGTLITVPSGRSHAHKGAVILTDVELSSLSALGYLYYEVRNSSEVISSADLTGGQNNSAYNEEGVIDMANARQAATLVALRTLGYDASAAPAGIAVYAFGPGANSARAPAIGSVIVGADGVSTLTQARLMSVLAGRPPGSSVSLTSHPIGKAKTSTRSYRLGTLVEATTPAGAVHECAYGAAGSAQVVTRNGHPQGCLPFGVEQTYRNVNLPFRVRLSSGGIVGPSAGLSFTLGLIEKLDPADLTGGKRVAATGTMSIDGAVGAIGGVAEKTRGVRAAGAQVFLVPAGQNYAVARANAGPRLKVIAVSSIGEAVAALEGLGGRIVRTTHLATS